MFTILDFDIINIMWKFEVVYLYKIIVTKEKLYESYCIRSNKTSLNELGNGINESIFAQKTGELSPISFNYFSDIGVYSILMPNINDNWIQDFYSRIIIPIKNYDEKYNTELFDTSVSYIENDGKIKETASALFLHKNTIRYRIGKIKELLNMEEYELSFSEQLSIAIKLYKIYNI